MSTFFWIKFISNGSGDGWKICWLECELVTECTIRFQQNAVQIRLWRENSSNPFFIYRSTSTTGPRVYCIYWKLHPFAFQYFFTIPILIIEFFQFTGVNLLMMCCPHFWKYLSIACYNWKLMIVFRSKMIHKYEKKLDHPLSIEASLDVGNLLLFLLKLSAFMVAPQCFINVMYILVFTSANSARIGSRKRTPYVYSAYATRRLPTSTIWIQSCWATNKQKNDTHQRRT